MRVSIMDSETGMLVEELGEVADGVEHLCLSSESRQFSVLRSQLPLPKCVSLWSCAGCRWIWKLRTGN